MYIDLKSVCVNKDCVSCMCVCLVCACVCRVCVCNAEVDTRQLQRHVSAGRTNKFFGRYF